MADTHDLGGAQSRISVADLWLMSILIFVGVATAGLLIFLIGTIAAGFIGAALGPVRGEHELTSQAWNVLGAAMLIGLPLISAAVPWVAFRLVARILRLENRSAALRPILALGALSVAALLLLSPRLAWPHTLVVAPVLIGCGFAFFDARRSQRR